MICRALGNIEEIYIVEKDLLSQYQKPELFDHLKTFSQWDPELIPTILNHEINNPTSHTPYGNWEQNSLARRDYIKWQSLLKSQQFNEMWQTKTILRNKNFEMEDDDDEFWDAKYIHGPIDWKIPKVKRVVLTTRSHSLDLWKGLLMNRRKMRRIIDEKTTGKPKPKSKMTENESSVNGREDNNSSDSDGEIQLSPDIVLLVDEYGAEIPGLPWLD